jgi:hypothetical protein
MAILTLYPVSDNTDGLWLNESEVNTNLYASVDEAVLSETDYIYLAGNAVTSTVLFNWGDHTTETGTITDVIFYAQADFWNITFGSFHFAIPDAGHLGSHFDLTSSSVLYHEHFTTNPHTGVAWTWADIDALTAGIQGTTDSTYTGNLDFYQTYIEVVYTAAATSQAQILVTI